jgi:hypothetical protein
MAKITIIKSWKQKTGTLSQHPDYIKFWEEDSTGSKKTKIKYLRPKKKVS